MFRTIEISQFRIRGNCSLRVPRQIKLRKLPQLRQEHCQDTQYRRMQGLQCQTKASKSKPECENDKHACNKSLDDQRKFRFSLDTSELRAIVMVSIPTLLVNKIITPSCQPPIIKIK